MSSTDSNTAANSASSGPNQVTHHHSHDLGHKSGTTNMFSGMKEYKRSPENSAGEARRSSLLDQSAKPQGVLSNMWNNTFRGANSK